MVKGLRIVVHGTFGSWFMVHGSSTSEATESSAWLKVHELWFLALLVNGPRFMMITVNRDSLTVNREP